MSESGYMYVVNMDHAGDEPKITVNGQEVDAVSIAFIKDGNAQYHSDGNVILTTYLHELLRKDSLDTIEAKIPKETEEEEE